MARIAIATALGLMLLAIVGAAQGKSHPWPFVPRQGNRDGNLVLYALGTGSPGPGQVRIPVPVEGTLYEVIVAKPGKPRVFPLAMSAGAARGAR